MADRKLFLLDAMALVFRAYYALIRSPRVTSYGKVTNAQFGFTNALLELLTKENPSHIAVVFDTAAPTERHINFEAYKANRDEAPEDLSRAIPDIKTIIKGFNIPCIELDGYEADDLIGTLAWQASDLGYEVYMVTPDKDYGQLVRDNVFIYKPSSGGNGSEILGVKEVCAKWQIESPAQVIDILGLMGDAVDNIPGIAGVGEKTASKLIQTYGSLENVLENAAYIKGALGTKVQNGIESARISKQLATIITDAPIQFHEEDFLRKPWDEDILKDIFGQLEFKTLAKRLFSSTPDNLDLPEIVSSPQMDLFNASSNGDVSSDYGNYKKLQDVDHQYHLVDTKEKIDDLIAHLNKFDTIAFDTETTDLDATQADIVGMSFSVHPHEAYYVPCYGSKEATLHVLEPFKTLFLNNQKHWVGHNIKYDILVLKNYDINIEGPLYDTMIASYVHDAESKKSMDLLSEKWLKYTPISIEELIGKKGKSQKSIKDVDVNVVKDYAAEDADVTLQLSHVFKDTLKDETLLHVLNTIELPLIPVLADMEHVGVKVDTQFLNDFSKELNHDLITIEEKVFQLAGGSFNLSSPRQLGEVLFDRLKLDPSAKKTKTGQYATGEEVLTKLQNKHEIIDYILGFRELSKLKSTYVDALPTLVNPRTGRIHTSFNQTVAVTGRLSSQNPNLQNIPIRTARGQEVRKAFVPEEGYRLLSADYSQIELRIIAAISGDENMIEAFVQAKDIHRATAAKVYGVPEEAVDSTMRRNAKAVNFGIIYGQSAFGLAENLGISRTEAKAIIDNYFVQYPGIKAYMETQKEKAKANGYIETITGRRRYLRDINSNNPTVRGFAERNAINMPIQGSAADMIKLAMINIHNAMRVANLQSRMLLQVHDELIFEVTESESNQMIQLVKTHMEQALPLPNNVPVLVESGIGQNWLEAH